MGSVDAAASVAGAGDVDEVSDEVVEEDESVVADELELDESDGGGGVVGGGELELSDCDRSMDWNCTPERVARCWSWTRRLACSLSAGTAFPSTTSRR